LPAARRVFARRRCREPRYGFIWARKGSPVNAWALTGTSPVLERALQVVVHLVPAQLLLELLGSGALSDRHQFDPGDLGEVLHDLASERLREAGVVRAAG